MQLNHSKRDESPALATALVIDFEAHKASRRERRLEAAAPAAAASLAGFEAGHVSWRELMAALVGPLHA